MSVNTKEIKKNAYRVAKTRGKTALRIRVPGGHLEAVFLPLIKEIADTYGNGTIHLSTRQGLELPGIDFDKIPEINKKIRPLVEAYGLCPEHPDGGYPASGVRNIAACIGNRVCPFANHDTTALAQRLEREMFPGDLHFKIAVTGCPNDCIKAHMQDFGIICTTEPQYDEKRCISCNSCVETCERRVTGALSQEDFTIKRSHELCIGCGECILKCPTGALTRGKEHYFSLVIMGRTGKKNPRLAQAFLEWADEETVVQVIKNTVRFVEEHIDRSLPKEHIGYIVDRTGYPAFRDAVLEGIKLHPKTRIAEFIAFDGTPYRRDIHFKTASG
ncbi:MAG: sulfite reductase subunit C [Victivallaceae bacterium]|jgi:anaerobic sulfite reductase subunit C